MEKTITKSATITRKQNDWLDKNPSINFSGLVREAIDARMKGK